MDKRYDEKGITWVCEGHNMRLRRIVVEGTIWCHTMLRQSPPSTGSSTKGGYPNASFCLFEPCYHIGRRQPSPCWPSDTSICEKVVKKMLWLNKYVEKVLWAKQMSNWLKRLPWWFTSGYIVFHLVGQLCSTREDTTFLCNPLKEQLPR